VNGGGYVFQRLFPANASDRIKGLLTFSCLKC